MKTDSWFFRLLKVRPAFFFELLGLPAALVERYGFDSIELKKTGFRIDGVFRPTEPTDPVFVMEIQGYFSPAFYANLFSKVFCYLEMNEPAQDWRAVAIFLQRSHEPVKTAPYEMLLRSPNVTRIYLDDLPAQASVSLGMSIWQLLAVSADRVKEFTPKVVSRLRAELTDAALCDEVIQLLEEFLVRKFVSLAPEEIEAMFQLADIQDTRVFQEGRQKGRQEGKRESKEEVVRNLLAEGFALAQIAKLVNLSPEEVRQIAGPPK